MGLTRRWATPKDSSRFTTSACALWSAGGGAVSSRESQVVLKPNGKSRVACDLAHACHEARHEADPVERVVPDRQQLASRAEQNLLMGHEASQPQSMHRYAVHAGAPCATGIRGGRVRNIAQPGIAAGPGDQRSGTGSGARRRIDLVGMVQLDDLD
jgi:hypothetical protein